jgi:hypothetical protein
VRSTKKKGKQVRGARQAAQQNKRRISITDEQVAETDRWVTSGADQELVEKYLAIPRRERKRRLTRIIQEKLEQLELEIERKRIALDVDAFRNALELVEIRRDMVLEIMTQALRNRASDDEASLEGTLSFFREADRLHRELDRARGAATAGAKALERANDYWSRGIGAACSRLLAKHIKTGERDKIKKVSDALHKPQEDVSNWLACHQGDLRTDGAQKTADRAIAALLKATGRTVQRWRSELAPSAQFFDRVLETMPQDDPSAYFDLGTILRYDQ